MQLFSLKLEGTPIPTTVFILDLNVVLRIKFFNCPYQCLYLSILLFGRFPDMFPPTLFAFTIFVPGKFTYLF